MKNIFLIITLVLIKTITIAQSTASFTVKTDMPTADVQSTMWGIFFEDINLGADGGIYAELIKNRSFEFLKPLMGWKVLPEKAVWQKTIAEERQFQILNRPEKDAPNPRYIHITLNNHQKGDLGLQNEGFRGMGIKKGLRYDFSVLYRLQTGNIKMHLELVNEKGNVIGAGIFSPTVSNGNWNKGEMSFNATDGDLKSKLNIWFEGTGEIDLDIISLFPADTWKGRKGGMRADMIQLLADMKPGFIRFPGGCIVEGFNLAQRYQWKKTIGAVEDRELLINRWNMEIAHRPAPDYYQTFGLGFFEYFQLAEDIGAAPLPILNCGMACQFNSAEMVQIDQLDPYIQDALDLIEFANGAVTTTWGKVRSNMGHPAPFNLKMMGIGNENWGPQYIDRMKIFQKAIKEKYPGFKIICSSGIAPYGDEFEFLNCELRKLKADFIDEHFYSRPEWFLENAKRYDNYTRNDVSKVFAGEYAAQSVQTVSPDNKNNWRTAIAEAAFMTGIERNADVVSMASYAPLFAHIDGWQWTPNLIWVNNLTAYGTPNYYVQKLYANNKGTKVLPMLYKNNAPATGQDSLYASSTFDENTGEVIVKIVNVSAKIVSAAIQLEGKRKLAAKGQMILLKNDNPETVNSFEKPFAVSPVEQPIDIKGKTFSLMLAPYSFSSVKVKMGR